MRVVRNRLPILMESTKAIMLPPQDQTCARAIFNPDPEKDQYPGHSLEGSLESMEGFHAGLGWAHGMPLCFDALNLAILTARSDFVLNTQG
jgi:hypothetical protein